MKLLSSLTNRIFLASAALAVLSIGLAVYFVNVQVTREAERELQRGLEEAGTLLEQHRATLVETFTLLARTIADLPKLKAAVATNDVPTVQPIAVDYQNQVRSDLFVVTDRHGRLLASIGRSTVTEGDLADVPAIQRALAGEETSAFWPNSEGVLQAVSVPISIGRPPTEILGSLSVGFLLDNALAAQFRSITDSEIAFADAGQIRAATLGDRDRPALNTLLGAKGISHVQIGRDDYIALLRPLSSSAAPGSPQTGAVDAAMMADSGRPAVPIAIILRSRTERLRFLSTIHTALAVTAVLAVLVATVLSYAVARTVTRPLAAITAGMREMAATGDLTRKIALARQSDWDDEDARLLVTTFNTLTDSIAAFQREAAQRERLSSLGRLSTVVAHEIRNPLMIMKASLRTIRRDGASEQEIREAVLDIDEEVARLNRVVNDVLDFARPVRYDFAECDLNAICTSAVTASAAGHDRATVHLHLDPTLPPVVTDAERLRVAFVNIAANARHAVAGRTQAADPAIADAPADARRSRAAAALADGPDIELRTGHTPDNRVFVVVHDRGVGIDPVVLPRVFDPYFTTKRTGTGLGLAIARNIVEGLGGAITVVPHGPDGTEIRVELPRDSRPPSTVDG